MKKKLANLLFGAIMALPATAQITILAMDDVKKSEPIDELVFRAQYELRTQLRPTVSPIRKR